jgi:pimeloyl-ACP methyl ester carboxylesterase
VQEGWVKANGIDFAYLEQGPADGRLALCLHGFPDTAWTWRHLLPTLGEAGFRAVAPFMRGYAPTALAPDGRYQTGALVADACALHEALGGGPDAVLVGHDWGALAAYGAAAHQPQRWRRIVAAAVPPPSTVAETFLDYDQLRRSWYVFFFQSPLAGAAVAMDDLAFIRRLWADWSPGYDASFDLPKVKDALRDPDNLEAAIGYYRALLDSADQAPELAAEQAATQAPTPQPTLYLHGSNDGCMMSKVARGAASSLGPGSEVVVVPATGHFLHLETPQKFNALVAQFLRR